MANVVGIVFKFYFDSGYIYGIVPLFDFNTEINIPTIYSSLALMFCSIMLSAIALIQKRLDFSYFHWIGLALIFLFLSVDEIASLHERLTYYVKQFLNTSGMFFYAWIIPYSIALTVFVITYFRFLLHLPKRIMFLFIVSGVIFVSGAIGFEMLGGWQAELYGVDNIRYCLCYTCEELLEMFGIVVFLYTLLSYITTEFNFFLYLEKAKRSEIIQKTF